MSIISEALHQLNESGLSKLYEYMADYDVACISADRYLPDRNEYNTQKEYEDEFISRLGKNKKLDSKGLLIKLKSKYPTVSIKGFYQYNKESVPSKEKSFMVANVVGNSSFKTDILNLGVECKQNSIYFVPKGTFEGYWIFTGIDLSEKDGIDKVHSYGDEDYRGPVHIGSYKTTDAGTGYSLINGRPFASYDTNIAGEIEYSPKKVKTKNISKNITIIDESVVEQIGFSPINKHEGDYLCRFKKAGLNV